MIKGGVRVCNFEKIDFFLSYLIVKHFKNIFPKFKSIREKFSKLLTIFFFFHFSAF